jgi:phosphate transport system substrate-binding protein
MVVGGVAFGVAEVRWSMDPFGPAPERSDNTGPTSGHPVVPFVANNRLAVPDRPASLRLRGPYPTVNGTAAIYPLYASLAQAVYQLPDGATDEDRSGHAEEYVRPGDADVLGELLKKHIDLGFVADPNKDQLGRAKVRGVELTQHLIAREAFVFFVHRDNPVTGLNRQQLRDIHAGRIANWKQLGGRDEAILGFHRPSDDLAFDAGSQAAMIAKVMGGESMAKPVTKQVRRGFWLGPDVAEYHNLPNAIGYSFRWHATVLNADPAVKLLAVDGIEPTDENLRDHRYPFTMDVFAITTGSKNPDVARFLKWIRGPEGRALVKKAGYVTP